MDLSLLMLVALGGLLIFFMFNSNRKRKAQAEKINNELVPGASVMTSFGLFGTVVAVDHDEQKVTIESGPGTTIIVHRQAIGRVDAPESATAAPESTPTDVAEGDVPGVTVDDETKPRITDEELDAINEAKRKENGSDDSER
ncbi:preprotein translocase subunit YajC [Brevibacterium litoralis]|uniref:preprotein translocase subunit YajC n=1 Tax=Brevibacterium litoralis TaxID=3138935 RepID=UPI0032EC30D1